MKTLLLSSCVIFTALSLARAEAKVCLNEVGLAGYKFARQSLQTKFEEVGDYPESSIASVRLAGAVMDEQIYSVKISGRRVTSQGMIIGPAEFNVIVNVKPDCRIAKTVQN